MTYYHEEAALYVTEKISLDQNKKTIFLVGDSIRMGYCGYTKEYLKDVADVAYPDDNCRYTQYTYVGLSQWKNIFPDPITQNHSYCLLRVNLLYYIILFYILQ